MVKERSYKILEQLDEYELQVSGESSGLGGEYLDESATQLAREHRNDIPSALDSDDNADDYSDESDEEVEFNDAVGGASSNAATSARSAEAHQPPSQQAQQQQTTHNQAGASSSSSAPVVPNPTDGVFANMSAKPDLYLGYDDKVPNEALP
ncbi:hypothetical protein LPJ73_005058, partial [Coemansia sp. RSA 2703]